VGKNSKLRYRAALEDAEKWAKYAFYSGDHTNPFPSDDRRHEMFRKILQRDLFVDSEFREMHVIFGGDLTELRLRPYPKPALVPIESLGPPMNPPNVSPH
jgi:hypothetical protein